MLNHFPPDQIEYHPYTAKAADPIVEFGKKHGILIESYGGLTPVVRFKDGPVTSVLASIRERLEKTRGQPVTEAQALLKWVAQKGIVVVTCVAFSNAIAGRSTDVSLW